MDHIFVSNISNFDQKSNLTVDRSMHEVSHSISSLINSVMNTAEYSTEDQAFVFSKIHLSNKEIYNL